MAAPSSPAIAAPGAYSPVINDFTGSVLKTEGTILIAATFASQSVLIAR